MQEVGAMAEEDAKFSLSWASTAIRRRPAVSMPLSEANSAVHGAVQKLEAALLKGEEADFSAEDPARNDIENSEQWGTERMLPAEGLARLMLSQPSGGLAHPERLVVRGARIVGRLDLGCGKARPFLFQGCRFDSPPNLNDCVASFVGFVACWLPGLDAQRIICNGPVWLTRSHVAGSAMFEDAEIKDMSAPGLCVTGRESPSLILSGAVVEHDVDLSGADLEGTVGLRGARISGSLVLARASCLASSKAPAVDAIRCRIDGAVLAAPEFHARGSVLFEGARIGGAVQLWGAKLSNAGQIALSMDHAEVGLGVMASDLSAKGALSMHHARVSCQLNFARAEVDYPRDDAIRADHVMVDGAFMLNGGAKIRGSIYLHGGTLDCSLNLYGLNVELEGEDRCGLVCDHTTISGALIANEVNIQGGMDLVAARVVDAVHLEGSTWHSKGGRPPLIFDFGRFEGGINAGKDFKVDGKFSMEDAYLGRVLNITDSEIGASGARSLAAAGTEFVGGIVGDRCLLRGSLDLPNISSSADLRFADAEFEGSSSQGFSRGSLRDARRGGTWRGTSVRLTNSSVRGDCDLRGATISESVDLTGLVVRTVDLDATAFSSQNSPGLIASRLTGQSLRMRFKDGPNRAIRLDDAQIGSLVDDSSSWNSSATVSIEGLTYSNLDSTMSRTERLTWLRQAVSDYSPQPYEQLAQSYDASGRARDARDVRYQSARRSHASGGRLGQVWGALQDVMIGYGYRPLRAVVWVVCAAILGALYFRFGIGNCAVTKTQGLCPVDPTANPGWDPYLYAVDLLVPFVDLGQGNAWILDNVSKAVMIALGTIGWILITTIAAAAVRAVARN